jgi:hypothetical protein
MSAGTLEEENPVSIAPDVSTEELLERARTLRPLFAEQVEETERLTHISEELHARVEEAGRGSPSTRRMRSSPRPAA